MLCDCTTELFEVPLKVAMIDDPFSTCDPQPTDKAEFSMIADGAPLHQYVVLSGDRVSHLLPHTNNQCHFYIPTAAGNRGLWGFSIFGFRHFADLA